MTEELTSFEGQQGRLVRQAWEKFLAAHPDDDSILRIDPPKADYDNRFEAGKSWRGDDRHRLRRGRAPIRLRSETAMVDGSPLRQLAPGVGAVDVDGDPWFSQVSLPASREDLEAIMSHPLAGDDDDDGIFTAITDLEGADVGAELLDDSPPWWLDGVHGEHVDPYSLDNKPYLLEYCAVCEWEPLPLEWPEPECEFPESLMPEGQYCHCNGCVVSPKRKLGEQPRYCRPKCESRMDNALDRADRRREGKRPRRPAGESWAPFLDQLAEYKREMRDRARHSKGSGFRYPFTEPPRGSCFSFTTFEPPLKPAPQPVRPKYCPPIRTAPVTRPSKLRAVQHVALADFDAVERAGRMRVECWRAEDREMYCGGKWVEVTEITTPEHPLTVGQTAYK